MKLSIVILTKNEECHIADCIASGWFADEILVIDDDSTDMTVSIAQQQGAHVISHSLTDFASQRNVGLSHARGDWVLFIDADERITPPLAREIQSRIMR